MADSAEKPAIIVVSSHVARGAVGNRAAVFALERLGFPVIVVPTVVLTWHPGEGPATRIVPPDSAFGALLGDLAGDDSLGSVGGILSGYLGSPGQAPAMAALVAAIKARNPDARYLCDPVTGDAAGAYVPAEVAAAIATHLWPRADMATPNRHELGLLLAEDFQTNAALIAAAREAGIGEVLITSAFAASGEAASVLVAPDGVWLARHAALSRAPHGTGDLLAALFLGHRLDGASAPSAFGRAVGSTFRLAVMADGGPMLPLAAGQAALVDPNLAVPVERIG